jgi:outer membrane protein assembly factor BamB
MISLAMLTFFSAMQVISAYPKIDLNNQSRWLCEGGNGSGSSYCDSTVHFPFSVTWDAIVPQAHCVLSFEKFFAVVRAGEVLVYQEGIDDLQYSITVDNVCVPCIYDGDLYSVSGKELIATKLSNGSISSSINMDYGEPEYLVPSEEFLLVVTSDSYLLSVRDGVINNEKQIPERVTTSPIVSKGVIAIACSDFNIHVFDYELEHIATSSTVGDIIDMVLVNDDCIVVCRKRGGVIALNPKTAKQIWNNKYPTGRNVHLVSDGKRVFLMREDSGIACIRPDGRTAWVNRMLSPSYSGVSGRLLFVATRDGALYPVQISTGQEGISYQTPGNLTAMPTILRDSAFLICGSRIIRLSTSRYGVYLGFEGDFDFDRLCPNKVYMRPINVINLTDNTVSVRIFCKVRNTSISETSFEISPNQEIALDMIVSTLGTLDLYERGEVIVDTPSYRYRLGIQYRVKQIPGDCNLDCIVDVMDFFIMGTCIGKRSYHQGYRVECDFDGNGIINELDADYINNNFGVTWSIDAIQLPPREK